MPGTDVPLNAEELPGWVSPAGWRGPRLVGVLQYAEELLGRPACLGRSRFFYVSSSSCLLARRDLLTQNMWTVMGDIQDAEELL